ncbi:MAG: glycosyltransferase family 2 protein [Bacteroidota bacterium]
MNALVSIIIPCYNVENYISDCLDSALEQNYRPIEIIAVDNNSTDNTLAILREYEARNPELITIVFEKKQGAPAARNKGISIAKGSWLQFLDADDLILPEKINRQMLLVRNAPLPDLIVGAHVQRYLDGKEKICLPQKGDKFKALASADLGYTVSNLFRSLNSDSQPAWDNNLNGSQDAEFIFKYLTLSNSRIIFDDDPSTITRERPYGQITKSQPKLFIESCIQFQLKLITYLKVTNNKYFLENEKFYTDNLYYYIYKLGLIESSAGEELFKKLMPHFYKPTNQKFNRITFVHAYGFKLLGFRNYVKVRSFFKKTLF